MLSRAVPDCEDDFGLLCGFDLNAALQRKLGGLRAIKPVYRVAAGRVSNYLPQRALAARRFELRIRLTESNTSRSNLKQARFGTYQLNIHLNMCNPLHQLPTRPLNGDRPGFQSDSDTIGNDEGFGGRNVLHPDLLRGKRCRLPNGVILIGDKNYRTASVSKVYGFGSYPHRSEG